MVSYRKQVYQISFENAHTQYSYMYDSNFNQVNQFWSIIAIFMSWAYYSSLSYDYYTIKQCLSSFNTDSENREASRTQEPSAAY